MGYRDNAEPLRVRLRETLGDAPHAITPWEGAMSPDGIKPMYLVATTREGSARLARERWPACAFVVVTSMEEVMPPACVVALGNGVVIGRSGIDLGRMVATFGVASLLASFPAGFLFGADSAAMIACAGGAGALALLWLVAWGRR